MNMIRLTDNLVITADEHQYIVGRPPERRDKAGNVSTEIKNPSYCTSLSSALKNAVMRAMREGVAANKITTLRQYLDEQQRLQDSFERSIIANNEEHKF
jgi:hypothetical protein